MAELYPDGSNRIFYRSKSFAEGRIVTVDILDPLLVKNKGIELMEYGEGLYYFDYNFSLEGTYVGMFYENDEKTTTQYFSIRRSFGHSSNSSPFKGDKVIGS